MPQLGRVQLCLQCSLGTARHHCFYVCVHDVFVLFICSLSFSLSLSLQASSMVAVGLALAAAGFAGKYLLLKITFTKGGGNVAVSHMVTTLIEDV